MLASQSSGSTRTSVTVSTTARAQSLTTKRSSLSKHTSTRSGRSKSLRGVSIHPSLKINVIENKNVALKSLDTTYQDLGSAVNVAAPPGNNGYVLNTSREPSTKPSHI